MSTEDSFRLHAIPNPGLIHGAWGNMSLLKVLSRSSFSFGPPARGPYDGAQGMCSYLRHSWPWSLWRASGGVTSHDMAVTVFIAINVFGANVLLTVLLVPTLWQLLKCRGS